MARKRTKQGSTLKKLALASVSGSSNVTPTPTTNSSPLPKKRCSLTVASVTDNLGANHHICGQRLDNFLEILRSSLVQEVGEPNSNNMFLQKCKAFFSIGINAVTRALERMPDLQLNSKLNNCGASSSANHLQAVFVAMDVHPRFIAAHLPSLAASRGVPLYLISGGSGTGSLRMGEILNVRTAIAVGLKATLRLTRHWQNFLKQVDLHKNEFLTALV